MKKVLLLLVCLCLMCGCTNKLHLDDKYYNEGKFIDVTHEELDNLDSKNYLLFTYNNYCNFSIPCDNIFREVLEEAKIDMITIKYEEFKETKFHDTVYYAPSVMIIKDGEILAYLDAEKDEDIIRYQDTSEFKSWLKEYISFKK